MFDKWRVTRTLQYVQVVTNLSKSSQTPLADIWDEDERQNKAALGAAGRLLLDSV